MASSHLGSTSVHHTLTSNAQHVFSQCSKPSTSPRIFDTFITPFPTFPSKINFTIPGPTMMESMLHDKYTSSNCFYPPASSSATGSGLDFAEVAKIFTYVLTEWDKKKAAAAKYSPADILDDTPPAQSKAATAIPYHTVAEYLAFTPPKELERPQDNKFAIRVTVCSTEEDYRKGAHEIVEIDTDSSLPQLKKVIRRHFQYISNLAGDKKINLKGAHISDEKILKIKAMYAGANTWDISCDGVPETTLTEENCSRTLKMLKKWGGRDTLCAIVAPPTGSE